MADKSAEVVAVAVLFLLLTWITVGLRMYVRTVLVRSVGNDDKVMVILLILFTVYTGLQIYGGTRGIGLLDSEISSQRRKEALRLWWILELLNVCSTCLLKISVGYFLLRVAIDRPHVWIIWILMAGTIVFGTTYLVMVMIQCRPIATYWEQGPRTPDKCWPKQVIYIMTIAATVINTSADFVFGTLPWFIVRSMNLPIGTKIVVVCILGLAAVGSTATIVRAFYIPTLLEGNNFLNKTTNFALWSTVEPGIGIVAACIATLRPLYQLVLSKMGRSSSGRSGPWREVWRQRHQARRGETSRQVRAVHNLDPEHDGGPPPDSYVTSPQGVLERDPPPALPQLSKHTNSTIKSRVAGDEPGVVPMMSLGEDDGDAAGPRRLTILSFPSALRLSDDFRRTMERPPEEWLAMIRVSRASVYVVSLEVGLTRRFDRPIKKPRTARDEMPMPTKHKTG
ncbi:integral membrane protein [Colletotrichum musicola]|uniref:Integral membrane protein n=1 Tax=Colletotrichum musicola TaxID=2175873 RepID=A0A8H6KBG3_9PEZI|nr:integral membrane protein [Colletotrichum musicola]